jgi:hypothetical protein
MMILGLQPPIDKGLYTFEVPPPATGYSPSLIGMKGQTKKQVVSEDTFDTFTTVLLSAEWWQLPFLRMVAFESVFCAHLSTKKRKQWNTKLCQRNILLALSHPLNSVLFPAPFTWK